MFALDTYSITARGIRIELRCPFPRGYVYLIHFNQPYKHAQHYLGSTGNLEARLDAHRRGTGARLMEVVTEAGITWQLIKIWECPTVEDARVLEARYKAWCNDKRLCPLCQHKPLDPITLLLQGHYPFHQFDKPGKRQPMIDRPMFYLH